MSYIGAEEVVPQYRVMGPVKAALEAAARYLAAELGPAGIRVHPISPGPLPTRAASGLAGFDELARTAAAKAPLKRLASTPAARCTWMPAITSLTERYAWTESRSWT